MIAPQSQTPLRRPDESSHDYLGLAQDQFSEIAELPSNHSAMALGFDFACGHRDFVGIAGPSGWGKSELLHRVAAAVKHSRGLNITVKDAVHWALSNEAACHTSILLLDDLQDAIRSPRVRHQLRSKLEKRARRKFPTMICAAGNFDRAINQRIISNLEGWQLAQIHTPSPAEKEQITRQIANAEQIQLHRSIHSVIGLHLNGNGRSIRGALLRLKLIKSDWRDEECFAEACGVLMPFFIGENGWDPRDVVSDAVNHVYLAWPSAPPIHKRAALAYLLNRAVRIPEEDVARFLRVQPGQVYQHCCSVSGKLQTEEVQNFLNVLRSHMFAALAHSAEWQE